MPRGWESTSRGSGALHLEFALAAYILRTAVASTWRDIGQLAAIAVRRTGFNHSLEGEFSKQPDG